MEIVINLLTIIIVVATTLRTVLQAVETLSSLPIAEPFIELAKLLTTFNLF